MKPLALFLHDQRSTVFAQLILVLLGMGIFLLERYRHAEFIDLASMYYYLVLAAFCIIVWNTVKYIRVKTYVQSLLEALQSDDALQSVYIVQGEVLREQQVVKQLLLNQQKHYSQQLSELQRKKEIQFHFTLQWVHQMKTPLSVLDLQLQQAEEQLRQEANASVSEKSQLYRSMNEEVEKLNSGLELMLGAARLEKLELDLHIRPVNLQQNLRDTINRYKKLFILHSIYPKLQGEATVATDQKWFGFVMNQLISNAIKYSKLKDGKKELTVKITQYSDEIIVTVQDEGIGIAEADIKRIFDPFFTGQNGRLTGESTGMGLYLAKEVCQRLGCSIKVSSVEGEGTTFTVIFKQTGIHHM